MSPTFEVEMPHGEVREVYVVEAESEDDARERWAGHRRSSGGCRDTAADKPLDVSRKPLYVWCMTRTETPSVPTPGTLTRKGAVHMTALVTLTARETEARTLALAFAATYPTPNVQAAVAYAESGRLEWSAIAALFARSYGQAINA